ncbi:unnamed protein product, partial [Didymodactylos carnosus]
DKEIRNIDGSSSSGLPQSYSPVQNEKHPTSGALSSSPNQNQKSKLDEPANDKFLGRKFKTKTKKPKVKGLKPFEIVIIAVCGLIRFLI